MSAVTVKAFLQARMSSTRLPGKVLKPLAGAPALQRQIERVMRAGLDDVVVVTSDDPRDDAIAELAEALAVPCFRGSLDDVLGRFSAALAEHPCEHVVRLTGDCPLVDPEVIRRVVSAHLESGATYTSNTVRRSWPKGLDVECVRADALRRANKVASSGYQREHVTPYFYANAAAPDSVHHVVEKQDLSGLRWTLDYPEDYAFIAVVYESLYSGNPAFSTKDVLALLEQRPDIARLNTREGIE